MNVLILGATGKLGSRVLNKLIDNNYSCGALLRDGQTMIELDSKVKIFFGNILKVASIEECISWADIVVNCIGKVSYRKKDKNDIYLANYLGAKNVLESCEKYNKQLIHTSSVAIYGCSKRGILFAETDISSESIVKVNSMYYTSKFDADMMVLSSNITKIILRPSSFITRKGSTLKFLLSIINKGVSPSLKGGASFVLIDDVAEAYAKAVELIQASSQVSYVFNLGGNNLSFKEVMELFKRQSNKRCFKIPYVFLLIIGYLHDFILDPLSKGMGVTSENVRLANRFTYIDSEKAKNMLGYKITSLQDSLSEIM